MGKSKKEKRQSEGGEEDKDDYEEQIKHVSVIANPLAHKKLTKRLCKCVKKAQKHDKKNLRKGVKEVQKYVRKGEKGLVLFAGDISPIEVICHMPIVCEDLGLPYCYIPSRELLGSACGSKRGVCMVMVKKQEDYADLYSECEKEIKGLPRPIN